MIPRCRCAQYGSFNPGQGVGGVQAIDIRQDTRPLESLTRELRFERVGEAGHSDKFIAHRWSPLDGSEFISRRRT